MLCCRGINKGFRTTSQISFLKQMSKVSTYSLHRKVQSCFLSFSTSSGTSCLKGKAFEYKYKRFSRNNFDSFRYFLTCRPHKQHTQDSSSPFHLSHDGRGMLNRYIFVKTLIGLYEDVPDGVIFDTAYADSRPGDEYDPDVPVIVGIHDTPGTHDDITPILSTFAKLGCRTIAATFPGHGNTQGLLRSFDDVFTQSTLEKAMYVQDFLSDLGIEKVDLLVGVGAGCYPTLRLCAGGDTADFYKSMALISPWPLSRPRFEPNPDLTRRIQMMWDRPFLRAPAKFLLPSYKIGDAHSMREKITAAYLINNLDLAEAASLAFTSVTLNIPRVVIFGELDEKVQKALYLDFVDSLDIKQTNIVQFDGTLRTPSIPGALSFPNEGYEVHKRHPGIISAYLTHLVKLSRPHFKL